MGFVEKLQAKLELRRLEKRYTNRDKRTLFVSDARYVNGEYVYDQSPPSPSKSVMSSSTRSKTSSTTATGAKRLSVFPGIMIRERETGRNRDG